MWPIETELDARSFPGLTVSPGTSRLTLSGEADNAFRVWFTERAPGLERVWPGQ